MNTPAPPYPYLERMIVDGTDEEAWKLARVGTIGGSKAAMFAKIESAHLYLKAILAEQFQGNSYTRHGNDREKAILALYGIQQNRALFHAEGNPLHTATPDGLAHGGGEFALVQVKTSTKPMPAKFPPAYLRQCWWEQYVMGTETTLLIWEQHDGQFAPLNMEPESRPIYRDDNEISTLVEIANIVLDGMHAAEAFRKELTS